jgi:hypothetical protein
MTSYQEQAARLRPLAKRADVERIFPKESFREHQSGELFGFKVLYGSKADKDLLTSLRITRPFPPSLDFYGFSIGMSLPEAEQAIERSGLVLEETGARFRRFSGLTPEGFEIYVVLGEEALTAISLAQPNDRAITEAEIALNSARAEQQRLQRERAEAWKRITDDDDAMLADWAAHCRPWTDYSPGAFVAFADWLRTASPDERHMAAGMCNWDYGLAPLLWISRRPDCDLATAWRIFFGCEPGHYLAYDGDVERLAASDDAYKLMIEIKARIDSGFYRRAEIFFDISRDVGMMALDPTDERVAAVMPKNIELRHEGRKISDWDIPQELHALMLPIS